MWHDKWLQILVSSKFTHHRDGALWSGMKSRKQACICFAVLWPLSVTISILHMYKHIVLYFLWCLLAENTLLLGGHCMGFGIQFWKWWTFEFTGPPPHTNSLLNQWSAVPEFIIHTGEKPKHVQHVRSLSHYVTPYDPVWWKELCVFGLWEGIQWADQLEEKCDTAQWWDIFPPSLWWEFRSETWSEKTYWKTTCSKIVIWSVQIF